MKTSDKQIAANQQNAQKSTGPTSDEGKATASKNSLKHGLLAKEVVITEGDGAESQAEFDALLSALVDQYAPQGPLEDILVEKIAVAHWRLRRAQRYEIGLIRSNLDNMIEKYYAETSVNSYRVKKNDAQIDAEIAEAQELLDQWQGDKTQFLMLQKAGNDIEAIYDFEVNWKWLHEKVSEKIDQVADDSPQTMRTSLNHAGWTDADIWQCHLDICDEQIHVQTHRLEALSKEKEKHHRALQVQKKLKSIPSPTNINQLLKYEGTLEKQFYKAINQLERLQRMRAGEAIPPPIKIDLDLTTE